jgi:hypothetical protein
MCPLKFSEILEHLPQRQNYIGSCRPTHVSAVLKIDCHDPSALTSGFTSKWLLLPWRSRGGFFLSWVVQLLHSSLGDMKHVYCLSLTCPLWQCEPNVFLGPAYADCLRLVLGEDHCAGRRAVTTLHQHVFFPTHRKSYFPFKSKSRKENGLHCFTLPGFAVSQHRWTGLLNLNTWSAFL